MTQEPEKSKANLAPKSPSRHRVKAPLMLISVIGDEETCVGFLMAGIGDYDKNRRNNFLVVKKDTEITQIEQRFKEFLGRPDIAVILITQSVADRIRNAVDAHVKAIPTIVEIPSSECAYDPEKDSIMKHAKRMFHGELGSIDAKE